MKKQPKKKAAPASPVARQLAVTRHNQAQRRSLIKAEETLARSDRLVRRLLMVRRDRELTLARALVMAHGCIVIPEHQLSDAQILIGELQEENIELRRQLEEAQRAASPSVRSDVPQGEVVGV